MYRQLTLRAIAPDPATVGPAARTAYRSVRAGWRDYLAHHRHGRGSAYRGHCSRANGASVLRIAPVGGAPRLHPAPDAAWGLHLADANIALGDLVSLVDDQIGQYANPRG